MPALTLQQIDVQRIKPSATQARQTFDETALQELAQSMKSEGLIQPVTVRPSTDGSFELISGERRLRAAKSLGWSAIDAVVQPEVNDQDAAIRGLIENLKREDLNPLERAQGYKKLEDMGLTLESIAEKMGVADKSTISRYLALLDMPQEVQDLLPRGNISETHARSIRQIQDKDQQIKLAQQADQEGWSAKETERRVKQAFGKKPKAAKQPAAPVPDPLADLWPTIQPETADTVYWEAKYGQHKLPGGQAVNGWFFFAMPRHSTSVGATRTVPDSGTVRVPVAQQDAKADLAAWFKKMAEAVQAGSTATYTPAIPPIPEADQPIKAKLPKTPEEEAELQKIAETGGPKAVYAWIYGDNSMMLKMVPFATWQEAGTTAEAGLKQILNGIRQMEGLATPTPSAEVPVPQPPQPQAPEPVAAIASPGQTDNLKEGAKQMVADVAKNLLGGLF